MKEISRLLKLYRPYRGWMILGIFLSTVTLLANVGLMALSGWFISAMALAGVAGITMNYFTPGAIIRFFAITRTAGRYAERLVTHEATFRLLSELRRWFYEHLEPLAPARLQDYHSGDLLSRIRADIDTLQNFYLRVLTPAVSAVLTTCLFTLFLAYYDLKLAAIEFTLLVIAGIIIPYLTTRKSEVPGKNKIATAAQLRTSIVEGVQGLDELLVFGAADIQADKIAAQNKKLLSEQKKLVQLSGIAQGCVSLCANLAMWLMLIIAIPLVREAELPPPHLAMLALFAIASFEAVLPLPLAFQSIGETREAARRIFSIVDSKPVISEPKQPLPAPVQFDFQLQKVSFNYPNRKENALNSIDLSVPQGSKIAVVGETGSGKSSLVQILLRFQEITQGKYLFAGNNVSFYHGDDLRSCFAVASQHNHLFNTTIRQNLLLANPDASQEEIEHACKTARILEFIESLPQGFNTYTGEAGTKLSGGQARRISIARALLKKAPILILDEPGEGLDTENEQELMNALLEQTGNCTLILITHSAVALKHMDEILVLKDGYCIERGNYADLYSRGYFQNTLSQH